MKHFVAGLLTGGLVIVGLFTLYTEAQQTEVPLNVEPGSPFAAEIISELLEGALSSGPIDVRNPAWPGVYQLPDSELSDIIEIRVVAEDMFYTCEKASSFFVNRMMQRRELNSEDTRQ
ncbi:MAG: hypothetical protein OXI13_10560 [Gammaproteobacteria bacterium]|nr:hypothetical protein [Gammaproteobacteria bacterium]MYA36201.1 hypothetical protein [Gammaproteobacteria bacterium]MYH85167.1 hypothetical protein [Gammaproteobacteria bacterium]MYK04191.1 hypothetical protein [Gammaproteobacteria bacterium]